MKVARLLGEREVRRFVRSAGVGEMTMVLEPALRALVTAVDQIVRDGVLGSVVECGCWRGGAGFLATLRLRDAGDERPVWLFDSFEGLPPPELVDGAAAAAWAADPDGAMYHDNCTAAIEQVQVDAHRLGIDGQVRLVKGWFDATLPARKSEVGPIALLRIDADWYASVRCCLDELYAQVSPGGLVILDDYYVWDGCTRAVHDFLAEHDLPHQIRTIGGNAFIRKPSR